MKTPLIMLLILMSLSSFAKFESKSWELKNNFKSSKVWKGTFTKSLYVAVEKNDIQDKKKYLNDLEGSSDSTKSKLLGLIGVSNWKRKTSKWKNFKNKKAFEIKGTYTDREEETVYFREYHILDNGTALKVVFTSVSAKSFKYEKEIASFINQISTTDIDE
mgnify:CR=1 FL=1